MSTIVYEFENYPCRWTKRGKESVVWARGTATLRRSPLQQVPRKDDPPRLHWVLEELRINNTPIKKDDPLFVDCALWLKGKHGYEIQRRFALVPIDS